MKFVSMLQLLRRAVSEGYGVPAFCVWNAESIEVVLRVAAELKAPVILMNGPGEFGLLAPRDLGAVAHALAERFDVPAALHLDHGNSMAMVEDCLAAKYTSVMLDYSTRPWAKNLEALRRVVALAHPQGVTVEGELGVIGQVDQVTVEGGGQSTLTDPDMAAAFVEKTGIDVLAVSIGNAHGFYTKLPHLDFERLAKLQAATRIPLLRNYLQREARVIVFLLPPAGRSILRDRTVTWRNRPKIAPSQNRLESEAGRGGCEKEGSAESF